MYTVTRQIQWPEGLPIVEVSCGGLDYCNPDALVGKYSGEFEEFKNPIEAVDAAISICRQWRKDGESKATVGIGATGGFTMPFDSCSFKNAARWAVKELETLEKCPYCNSILDNPEEYYNAGFFTEAAFIPYEDGLKYCSGYCAEKSSEREDTK